LKIEERMVDSEIRYVLPKVWVQFTGLPAHLRDYSIIWAVGAILGVTKDVDMVFTRRFDICQLNVLLMNPNLVPQAINVVIGENLYNLKFCVELDPSGSNPQPMETDSEQESRRRNPRMDAGGKGAGTGQKMGQNSNAEGQSGMGNSGSVSKGVPKNLLPTFHIQLPREEGTEPVADSGSRQSAPGARLDISMQTNHGSLRLSDESSMHEAQGDSGQADQGVAQKDSVLAEIGASSVQLSGVGKKMAQENLMHAEDCVDGLSVDGSLNLEEEQELEEYFKEIEEENRVEEASKVQGVVLAAIPEASPSMSNARRGKRRASEADIEVAQKAERIKALRYEGNFYSNSPVSYGIASFIPNLENLGIAIGNNENCKEQALLVLNNAVHLCPGGNLCSDKKREVLDLEEKELEEEDEVDKLLLQNICGKIMEEVMDVVGD
jgi:hypothetical protein